MNPPSDNLPPKSTPQSVSRRSLFKLGAIAGTGLAASSFSSQAQAAQSGSEAKTGADTVAGMRFSPTEKIKVGLIGTGGRGTGNLENLLAIDNVQVTAVCDVVKDKALNAQAMVERAGQHPPAVYSNGDHDFENLVKREDLHFVYIATPWDWHVPMAVSAMQQGKHATIEVPAATTLEDCWKLVDTSEKTRRHCIMMENCCYGEHELLVLNMIRAGLLGDLLHGEAAYIHDLREEMFSNKGEGLWRRWQHTLHNGNLYPTHGLGPLANYLSINRGDKFEYLVSMSSPQMGLDKYRADHITKDDPMWDQKSKEKYICGDMNTSLIKTAKGRTVMLQHDTSNPRPYDRINLISGTKGVFRDYPARVYMDGQPGKEDFTNLDPYKAQYEHRLWKAEGEIARKLGGHGGMDFIMFYRLIECMRLGLAPDMDVYDAAAWSAPAPLSQISVAKGSAPIPFPDFTRGKWKDNRELTI